MSTSAYLSGTGPDGQPGRWLLDKAEFIIGRQAPADLVIPLRPISRQHARIECQPQGYYLTDMGSRNGTFVNGEAVGTSPQRLYTGDEIVLGGVAMFHFRDPEETVQHPRLGRLKGVWIDEDSCAVWVDGQPVDPPLSQAQFSLLALLYDTPGKVVAREQIVAAVWPDADPAGVSDAAINGLIKRLRQRLRDVQTQPRCGDPRPEYVEVLRGHGIRLNQPEG